MSNCPLTAAAQIFRSRVEAETLCSSELDPEVLQIALEVCSEAEDAFAPETRQMEKLATKVFDAAQRSLTAPCAHILTINFLSLRQLFFQALIEGREFPFLNSRLPELKKRLEEVSYTSHLRDAFIATASEHAAMDAWQFFQTIPGSDASVDMLSIPFAASDDLRSALEECGLLSIGDLFKLPELPSHVA